MTVSQSNSTTQTPSDLRTSIRDYRNFHREAGGLNGDERKQQYRTMINDLYFNLVTDFYEIGWGRSFHFAPRRKHESFHASLRRFEHVVAASLQVSRDSDVLDIGCGVGGPMITVAKATGARITGINFNERQIARGEQYLKRADLADRCRFLRADYMQMPLADGSFDAAYSFCALPHAPDKRKAYNEIARVLKPGAILAGTDWCLTEKYDDSVPEHQEIKRKIQLGSALPDIDTVAQLRDHLTANFEILTFRDIITDCDPETPWYLPLSSKERSLRGLTATPVGRTITRFAARGLESVGLAPKGTTEISNFLIEGADGLVEGGKSGLFTIISYVARKRA